MSKFLYLLHFDEPIHHAKHYLGITDDLMRRLGEHSSGTGAKITAELHRLGIGFQLACVWRGATTLDERYAKTQKNAPQICPICKPFGQRNPLKGLTLVSREVLTRSGIKTNWQPTEEPC